jgi:hypothetical protein
MLCGVTRKLDNPHWSAGDRARAWAYLRDFVPGIVGYMLVLLAVVTWGDLGGDSGWRLGWVLLPVLPVLWVVRAVARHLRRVDEYGRLVLLRGLAGGFVVAMVSALTVGFLELAGLQLSHGGAGWLIYGAGMVGWLVAGAVASRA